MSTVYVVNKSSHDFSSAEEYGTLKFLSEGMMNKFEANHMARTFKEALEHSSASDYILPCGLSVMNMIACAMFATMHGRLNLLLFYSRTKSYKEVNLIFKE